ncbi:MAG: YbaK/EbsC family protein [Myxococcota bacterium]|nr:YbaK/EbsC family protein [Myxococcota bacterium]
MQRLSDILDAQEIPYTVRTHAPAFTSQQAAKARGTPLASGAKALICKANNTYNMFVMPAHLKLSTRNVRAALSIQRLRFATEEELYELTGLLPGCIPPFGSLFGVPTWCDVQLMARTSINFSAGDHGVSISMAVRDYNRLESPHLGRIAK